MDERRRELSIYRIQEARNSYKVAENCLKDGFYKDSINRSYYAAFYAVKSVLALVQIDFKRHKDVVAYFNKEFVAKGKFPGEMGGRLARLKMKREVSDYSDFFIASADEAQTQLQSVEYILPLISEYLAGHGVEIV